MRCLLLALLTACLGLGLRLAVPVAPVDASFRAVLRSYAAPADPSNTPETPRP